MHMRRSASPSPEQSAGAAIEGERGVRTEWDNGLSGELSYYYVGAALSACTKLRPTSALFRELASRCLEARWAAGNLLNLRAGYRFWQQKAAAGYMRDAEVAISVFNALNDEQRNTPGRLDRPAGDGLADASVLTCARRHSGGMQWHRQH